MWRWIIITAILLSYIVHSDESVRQTYKSSDVYNAWQEILSSLDTSLTFSAKSERDIRQAISWLVETPLTIVLSGKNFSEVGAFLNLSEPLSLRAQVWQLMIGYHIVGGRREPCYIFIIGLFDHNGNLVILRMI